MMKIVVAVTGASGIPYGVRLVEQLAGRCELHLVVSGPARMMMVDESGHDYAYLKGLADHVYDNEDMTASVCSGSFLFDAMAVVPCSMSTLGKLASGISDNVVTRAGSVALKEKRKLIIVPRETPLNLIQIENMGRLARAGAIILPAMPGFYSSAKTVDDLVNFVVARIQDQLGIENMLVPRWK